jgi:hypothetical protein
MGDLSLFGFIEVAKEWEKYSTNPVDQKLPPVVAWVGV